LGKELFDMLNYWGYRLSPLFEEAEPERLMLICDRVGEEFNYAEKKQGWFFGGSGALGFNPIKLYGQVDKKK
jgi:hypothetical protein